MYKPFKLYVRKQRDSSFGLTYYGGGSTPDGEEGNSKATGGVDEPHKHFRGSWRGGLLLVCSRGFPRFPIQWQQSGKGDDKKGWFGGNPLASL